MQHSLFGIIPAYHRHPPVSKQMTLYPGDRGQVCPALLMLEIPTWGKIPVTLVRVAGPSPGHSDGDTTPPPASTLHILTGMKVELWLYIIWILYLGSLPLGSHIHITWWKVARVDVCYTQQNVKMLVLDSIISSYDDFLFTIILFSVLVYYFIGWLWYFPDCSVIVQES